MPATARVWDMTALALDRIATRLAEAVLAHIVGHGRATRTDGVMAVRRGDQRRPGAAPVAAVQGVTLRVDAPVRAAATARDKRPKYARGRRPGVVTPVPKRTTKRKSRRRPSS